MFDFILDLILNPLVWLEDRIPTGRSSVGGYHASVRAEYRKVAYPQSSRR
jgi:hypothetical protein